MILQLPLSAFYPENSPFRTDEFFVKNPTIEDEDRLFNPDRIKAGKAVDDFVRGLIDENARKEYNRMYLIDRNFIIYAVRVAMFGENVELKESIECPSCGSLIKEATLDSEVYIPENKDFILETDDYKIKFKLLTVADQNVMTKDPLMKSNFLTRTLYYLIDTIEKEGSPPEDKYSMIRKMPIRMSSKIREFLETSYPKFDVFMKCGVCGEKIKYEIDESFFWYSLQQ